MLARWSSWGAVPQVFDNANDQWAEEREYLRSLLDADAYTAARRTIINAHYTDAGYVSAMWDTLGDLGFEGGDVLEPGAGSGTFIGMAPDSARMVGVELDPTTASIAQGLYPGAEIRTESFAESRFPRGHFDATIGNVPFAETRLYDPQFNANNHSMHNHFIVKSLALTRPGGMAVVLTSVSVSSRFGPGVTA